MRLSPTFVTLKDRLDRLCGAPSFPVVALLGLAALYFCAYLSHPNLPFESCAKGWWEQWDQLRYLDSTRALAQGQLDPASYWYPLGYPALGALFAGLLPLHPYFLVNLGCALGASFFFWKLSRRGLGPSASALLQVACLALLSTEMNMSLVKPWNTIPTMTLAYGMLWLAARTGFSFSRTLALSALAGAAYLIRPVDAAFLLPIALLSALKATSGRGRLGALLAGAGLFALFPVCVAALNLQVFGSVRTPYELNSALVGFGWQGLPRKIYSLFVDGLPVYGQARTALIPRMPWLLLVPAGLWAAWRRECFWTACLGCSMGLCLLAYCAYNDFTPLTLYAFELVHYLFWLLPLCLLLAALALRDGLLARPRAWGGLALAGLLLVCVRLETPDAGLARVDAQGRLEFAGGVPARADMAVLDVPAKEPNGFGSLVSEEGTPLRPFKDYLLWNDMEQAHLLFAAPVEPARLRLDDPRFAGRSVRLRTVDFGLRGLGDMPELALRVLGGRGVRLATAKVRLAAGSDPNPVSEVVVELAGLRVALEGASAWFVSVGGVAAFSSAQPALPLTQPLRAGAVTGGWSAAGVELVCPLPGSVSPEGVPPGTPLVVAALDAQGRALAVWKGTVR